MVSCMLLLLGLFVCFGFIYPAVMVLIYPIYKRLGGDKNFKQFMEDI